MQRLERPVLERLGGTPRLLLFDVDGTLAPLAPRPDEAAIPASTRQTLSRLAATEGTVVALVSGRGARDARRFLPDVPSWVIGNHGCEILDPSGALRVAPLAEPYRERVQLASQAVQEHTRDMAGVIVEDKTWTLSVHYRLADPSLEEPLRRFCRDVADRHGLRLHQGKKIHELRPTIAIDKGTAVLELVRSLGGFEPGASVLFAGDDVTDEDAFMALRRDLPGAVTVFVGNPETVRTAAEVQARGPKELADFLSLLADAS